MSSETSVRHLHQTRRHVPEACTLSYHSSGEFINAATSLRSFLTTCLSNLSDYNLSKSFLASISVAVDRYCIYFSLTALLKCQLSEACCTQQGKLESYQSCFVCLALCWANVFSLQFDSHSSKHFCMNMKLPSVLDGFCQVCLVSPLDVSLLDLSVNWFTY